MTEAPLGGFLDALRDYVAEYYGDRLVSLAVFGSRARGVEGPDSDLDFLIVAKDLPRGRMARVEEFAPLRPALVAALEGMAGAAGERVFLSPLFKTPSEVRLGSPIFLDMSQEGGVEILFDRDRFLARYLADLRERLRRMGARRVGQGREAHWILTPHYTPGQIIEI